MDFSIQGLTSGTAAGWLSDEALIGLQELFNEEYLSQFPLLSLFNEAVHDSEDMIITTFIKLLSTGVLTAKPEPGRRLDPTMMIKSLIKPFYGQYILDLDTTQALALLNPAAGGSANPSSASDAVRKLVTGVGTHIETYWRTLHTLIAKIMCTPGGHTVTTADGVDHLIDWGFPTSVYSADWATASTDILTDFGRMKRKFKRLNNGRNPNLYIFPDNFANQFLLANADLRDAFLVRHPEIMRALIPTLELPQSNGDRTNGAVRIIEVSDATTSEPAVGTEADLVDVWPRNIFAMGRIDKVDQNFQLNTARTLDNDLKGGMGTHAFTSNNPRAYHVRVSGNHIPSWAQPKRLMVCKVSASTTEVLIADVS